ncbi:MAG: DUF2281 domain-containing protein [Nitrospinota bacterium]|nr:MAG: DUF2281 domain-containing protein [Nitrospinota bacterium]
MSIEQQVLEKLKLLPLEKQQEVLDFVEFLQQKVVRKHPRQSLKGLWADLGVHITEEDIAEVRCEMWGNLPREDI